ncbi:hypothetical protein BZL29_6998 [Mycobacterium kansasii]|uniref:Uncharacterized protein n=1 Tax=Mycobacterium kansasii TaxID=1768 RepID=A0A1V3WN80_MYCKA|nr:hypothetical protein BZL29_6998 [Mycobacterium kansasii]
MAPAPRSRQLLGRGGTRRSSDHGAGGSRALAGWNFCCV